MLSLLFLEGAALGEEVDDALGLPTTRYTISENGGAVIFTGGGNGHGVGLCQVGAIRISESK